MGFPVQEVFSDRQYCIDEMHRIRETWGSWATFTPEAIKAARTSLGFMLLYCPENLRDFVLSMVDELGRREILADLYPVHGFRKRQGVGHGTA